MSYWGHLTSYELAVRKQRAQREKDYAIAHEIEAELQKRAMARRGNVEAQAAE